MPQYKTDETGMAMPKSLKPEALGTRAFTESQVYSLLNPYLKDYEKSLVEVWYQLPGLVFFYVFLGCSVFDIGYPIRPVIISIYASLLAGIGLMLSSKSLLKALLPITVVTNRLYVAVPILLASVYYGKVWWLNAVLVAFVALSPLAPGVSITTAAAASAYPKLHEKYGIAKILFLKNYTFEKYFDESHSALAKNRLIALKFASFTKVILLAFSTFTWWRVS